MYKLFFNESYFLLTDDRYFINDKDNIFIHSDINITKEWVERFMGGDGTFQALIFYDKLDELLSIFKSYFKYVEAAGGVVKYMDSILVIKRFGRYDLPKGHVEDGENYKECAIREVCEECGLSSVELDSLITETYHIYRMESLFCLKRTLWYSMSIFEEQRLVPQIEEGIEDLFWLDMDKVDSIKESTYPSLVDVVDRIQILNS